MSAKFHAGNKLALAGVLLATLSTVAVARAREDVTFECTSFRYSISAAGRNTAFVDAATGVNYLASASAPCAVVRVNGREYAVDSAARAGNRLTLQFDAAGVTAHIATEVRPASIVFRVAELHGENVESLTFVNIPLAVQGSPDEPFGACAHSLNLFTRVDALPALQRHLLASCERKFGLVGAKAAIVAAPVGGMLPALQDALGAASELPVCKVAGPWARDAPFNRGSYLFNFGSLAEDNVEEWIESLRRLGFTQIDNHGGGEFFRFGDFQLNAQKWPEGWAAWHRIVDRLHQHGVGSILHTYAFFIDKRSKYVTPVPDRRLDAFRTFTLAAPVTAEADEMLVNEPTDGITTLTGFFEQNSVVLHVGNELISFSGASKEAPWRFTGLTRGALGTKAASHAAGTPARHLKEMFGLFVPDVESSLFEEIAANHADVVNQCGFDSIYLDAIDGGSILRGGEENWYWSNKFVVDIQKRLHKPIGMEMSSMGHHFWQYRTRWQAWDLPRRGHKQFVNLHAEAVNGGLLLPLHLGWWGLWTFEPPQIEPTYPDVMEYLGAKLIGWDAGVSLAHNSDRTTLQSTPLFQRAAETLRICEDLRHSGAFDEAAKAKLREPGSEFELFQTAAGAHRFRRCRSYAQTAALGEPWTQQWSVANTFASQPARFRIEALMSAAAPAEGDAVVIADLATEPDAWQLAAAEGVTATLSPTPTDGGPACALSAANAGTVPRNAAWARWQKRFSPPLNLKQRQAISVEIEGDGSGAVLAFRMESPAHLGYGAIADRYVAIDFKGRRRITLIETDSTRWSDYVWNDGKHPYHVYRELVDFGAVDSLSVWLQNVPAEAPVKVIVGAIHAVPLSAAPVIHPAISIDGEKLEFPVTLAPGSWLEGNSPDDCTVYGSKGEKLGSVVPRGAWPVASPGAHRLEFSCEQQKGPRPRARITVTTHGEEL